MFSLPFSKCEAQVICISHHHYRGCPLPGSVQGQVGWSSEQPGLVEDVPAHVRGAGAR